MPIKGKDITIPDVSLHQLLWRKCLQYGSATCLVDNSCGGKSVTFRELYVQSRTCAAFLFNEGLSVGDFVGLCAQNCVEYAIVTLGIMGCGATVTPCNPEYKEGEILQQFRISEPKAVFVHESALETLKRVKDSLPCIKVIYVIGESDEYTSLPSILKRQTPIARVDEIYINPTEDIALLAYSSGTTGLPKSVMKTHRNLVAYVVIFEKHSAFSIADNACGYTNRPFYHGAGFGAILVSIALGRKLVMDRDFEIETMLKAVEKYRVTHLSASPPALIQLANIDGAEHYDTSSLKVITSGGAMLAPDVLRRVMEKYKVPVSPVYGLTEAAGLITLNNDLKASLSSVGTVSPGTELKITDLSTGEECAAGQIGEMIVRGPQVMKGYFKNAEATANAINKDGWLHTGDIGHVDENGFLYVVDRIKEVIKYGPLQVPPAELESVILQHPKVADVGVIGIPDPEVGEVPKAFVVKRRDSLTDEEVDAIVKRNLADYKHLRGGIEFVDAIPRSAVGKIQRKDLKKMAGFEV